MKITSVTTVLHDRRTDTLDVFGIEDGRLPMGVLVIATDEGIEGHCTLSYPGPGPEAIARQISRFLTPVLVGADPLEIGRLWRRMDVSSDGFRWVTVGAPGQDVNIVLSQPHGGRSQAEGDALLALVTQGSLQAAIFSSDDLDTTFEKVRASGAEVLQEPVSQPWGARDCAFRDPSGNLVRIAQA